MFSTPKRIGALVLATAMFAAACGGAGETTAPTSGPTGTPAGSPDGSPTETMGPVEGTIFVSGSSTVEPISSAVAEMFKAQNPGFNYTVEGPGTGDGFQKFCNGETDISDASRPIREAEIELCQQNNVEYVELKVAVDGISVITSVNNNAISCLSFADLYALIGPESTGFDSWADAQPIARELGSNVTFPDAPLVITAPGEESGTFDSFVELVIAGYAEDRGQDETTRPDYTASPNDNAIIEGIAGSDTSLGWVGFAFFEENQDVVRALEVSEEPNGECVAPTPETIADNSYPISRDLYIYVNKAKAAENPALAAYVDYYLAEGTIDEVLETVPYVRLTDENLAASRSAWEAR